jgi:hypothetical protein
MIKKRFLILFVLCLILINFLLIASASDIQSSLEDNLNRLKEAKDKAEQLTLDEQKWTYLGQEWRTLLLKNSVVSGIDGFLKKINFVFVFLFGERYDISLLLLFVIIFWFFFLFSFNTIFRDYSAFSKNVALVISFAITIVSAQIGVCRKFSELTFKLIFYKEGVWGWISFCFFLMALLFVYYGIKQGGKTIKKSREHMEKEEEKMNRKILKRQVKSLSKIGGK